MKYKGFKKDIKGSIITEHISLEPKANYVEAMLPNNRYILIEFNKQHKVNEHYEWKM